MRNLRESEPLVASERAEAAQGLIGIFLFSLPRLKLLVLAVIQRFSEMNLSSVCPFGFYVVEGLKAEVGKSFEFL